MANVTTAQIKELRELSGAGMLDCRNALNECDGDVKAAQEWLRRKGMAKAESKASRNASEARIGCYMHHTGKLGVLVELFCETDFVANTEDFKNLLDDICLQVASMHPTYVSRQDIPEEIMKKELDGYMKAAMESGKPQQIAEKMAQGQADKYIREMCLLEQPFVKDESVTISDKIKQTIGKLGENIVVKRFCRMAVGE